LFRGKLTRQLNGEDWILFFYRSISRPFQWPGEKGHTASRLGTAGHDYDWVYSFKRTSTLLAKLGNPLTVLLLHKSHCHPGERVSSE
jgi:hypothetical protein